MKQQINEIKRLQQLAGILKENDSSIEEAKSPFYNTGYEAGPNGSNHIDPSTKEGQYVLDKANQLYTLLNDKSLIDFAKGYVWSIGSSQYQYEGLKTVAKALLELDGILKEDMDSNEPVDVLAIMKQNQGREAAATFESTFIDDLGFDNQDLEVLKKVFIEVKNILKTGQVNGPQKKALKSYYDYLDEYIYDQEN